jgi:sugar phosphate isomerase/epimerase
MDPKMEEGSMKVGVFTVGLPDLTPEEAVREIKDAGYDGVEWRVTRVPEELRGEEPSFWGNNLCTLAPRKRRPAGGAASRRRRAWRYLDLALTLPSVTWRLRTRRCASL